MIQGAAGVFLVRPFVRRGSAFGARRTAIWKTDKRTEEIHSKTVLRSSVWRLAAAEPRTPSAEPRTPTHETVSHAVLAVVARAADGVPILGRFPGDTLFERVARAVCRAGSLPRKELYEAWEVARRVRRLFRGGRVVDLGGGHGLLAHIMLVLDDSSTGALVVDVAAPLSAAKLEMAIEAAWPRLAGRISRTRGRLEEVEIVRSDVVVSSHACGSLTDRVLDRAVSARARVGVLPCCHDLYTCNPGGLTGWVDGPLAVDIVRATRLREQGYRVWTQTIPSNITPKNRLLLGAPGADG